MTRLDNSLKLDVTAMDHIYISVSDLKRSTDFYDGVMRLLGFRKGTGLIGGEPHVHYFNRILQYTIRPARNNAPKHDSLIPGLHHICFQVADFGSVDEAATGLRKIGVEVSEPQIYPEYGKDYYAVYFKDPDGIELEIVCRTKIRDLICNNWDVLVDFEDPLSKAGLI